MRSVGINNIIPVFAAVLMVSGSARTAAAEGEVRKLGLKDCITLSTDKAEKEGRFDAELMSARAGLMEANSGFWPHLKVTPEARYYFDGANTEIYFRGDLGQRLLEIPQNLARRRMALEQIKSAEHRKNRARCQQMTSVMKLYAGYLSSLQELKISQKRLAAAEKSAAKWKQVNPADLVVKKQKEDAEKNLRMEKAIASQLEVLNKFMRDQLIMLCGIKKDEVMELQTLPEYKAPEVTIDQCLAWAMDNRSDLLAAKKEAVMLKEAMKLAKMDRWPKPRLLVGYGETGSETDISQKESVFAALAIELSIWDAGEIAARVKGIEARIKGANLQMEILEKRINESVILAYSDWYKASQLLLAGSGNEKAIEEYKRAELRYRNGEITEVEFLTAEAAKLGSDFETLKKNISCFEKEADLLEAIEAGQEQFINGLKEIQGAGK